MSINSSARVSFSSGELVPLQASVRYLGVIIEASGGHLGELAARLKSAATAFAMLRPLWRSRAVTLKHKVLVYRACVLSRLLYCTGALVLPQTAINSMEARHASYVRRLLAISATWGSIKMGEAPVNNRKVLAAA
eukprot:4137322-Alexandrium_andersonii.AAC.1